MPKQRRNTAGRSKATPASLRKGATARTLFNGSELYLTSVDVADAAQLLTVKDAQIQVELAERLQSIARIYWRQHRDAQRPPADWYRANIAPIKLSVEKTLSLLRNAEGTALSQLEFRTVQRMGRRLKGLLEPDPISVERLLADFAAACGSCVADYALKAFKWGNVTADDILVLN